MSSSNQEQLFSRISEIVYIQEAKHMCLHALKSASALAHVHTHTLSLSGLYKMALSHKQTLNSEP